MCDCATDRPVHCPFLCPQIKFERDLRRIWLKAGLKEAPAGWQTPKIYLKGK